MKQFTETKIYKFINETNGAVEIFKVPYNICVKDGKVTAVWSSSTEDKHYFGLSTISESRKENYFHSAETTSEVFDYFSKKYNES